MDSDYVMNAWMDAWIEFYRLIEVCDYDLVRLYKPRNDANLKAVVGAVEQIRGRQSLRTFCDDLAINKHPQAGKCPVSPFANGYHRVASVRYLSLVDGALAGDKVRRICMECGKVWEPHGIVIRDQPTRMGTRKSQE